MKDIVLALVVGMLLGGVGTGLYVHSLYDVPAMVNPPRPIVPELSDKPICETKPLIFDGVKTGEIAYVCVQGIVPPI